MRFFFFFLFLYSIGSHQSATAQCNLSFTIPEDITICDSDQISLEASISGSFIEFEWNGTNGFFDDVNLSTTDLALETTTYTFSVTGESNINLINNGDFEQGNTGFSTDYVYSNPIVSCPSGNQVFGPLGCEGTYLIVPNAAPTHIAFSSCTDHTGGGNMMVINGAAALQQVWCQTLTVTPNTDYVFRAWATSVEPSSPAILQFSIDGNLIGSDFPLSNVTCQWQEFYEVWNSGSSTSIEICITNQNFNVGGNDFAIDDIYFGELCEQSDSFTVTIPVLDVEIDGPSAITCDPSEVLLTSNTNISNATYYWYTFDGQIVSDPSSYEVLVANGGNYILEVTDENGCSSSSQFFVEDNNDIPEAILIGDLEINCTNLEIDIELLPFNPVTNVSWQSAEQIIDIYNARYSQPGTYIVYYSNDFACIDSIEFEITYNIPNPIVEETPTIPIKCPTDSALIAVMVDIPIENFSWSGPNAFSSEAMSTFVTNAGIYYYEFSFGDGCLYEDSVLIQSAVSPISYTLSPNDTIDCNKPVLNLFAQADSSISVFWEINNGTDEKMISVSDSGIYNITLIDNNGCQYIDSVTIALDFNKPDYQYTTKKIDCIQKLGWATVSSLDSSVSFTWIDNMIEYTTDTIFSKQEKDLLIIAQGQNGCKDSSWVTISTIENYPNVTVEYSDLDCTINTTDLISVCNISECEYKWTQNTTIFTDSIIIDAAPGEYLLEVISPLGCIYEDTILIDIDTQRVNIKLYSDTITCIDKQVNVVASFDAKYDKILWEGSIGYPISDSLFVATDTGSVIISVVGNNGCTNSAQIQIEKNTAAPVIGNLSSFVLNCKSTDSLVNIIVDPNAEVRWFLDGSIVSDSAEIIINQGGEYTVVATSRANGCSDTSRFEIVIDTLSPSFTIEYNDITCLDTISQIQLIADAPPRSIISYDIAQQDSSFTSFMSSTGGTFRFEVIGQNYCSKVDSILVEVDTIKPSTYTEPIIIGCSENQKPLPLYDFRPNTIISWSGPNGFYSEESTPSISDTGQYIMTATNFLNGCVSQDTSTVTKNIVPLLLDYIVSQPQCFGDSAYIKINNIEGGTGPWEVQLINSKQENILIENNLQPGSYQVKVVDNEGCLDSVEFEIEEREQVIISAGMDLVIKLNEEAILNASTDLSPQLIGNFQWSPASLVDCSSCFETVPSSFGVDTSYIASLTDIYGCTAHDTVSIRYLIDVEVYTPNIFSPDKNNINDVFFITVNRPDKIKNIDVFRIFDRWGNLAFEANKTPANDPNYGWNGDINGSPAASGVYTYYAIIKLTDGSIKQIAGDITIIY